MPDRLEDSIFAILCGKKSLSRSQARNALRGCLLAALAVVIAGPVGCSSNGSTASPSPVIVNISPNSGTAGTPVTITGANFGNSQGGSSVLFNNTPASPSTWSSTSITVPAPAGVSTGLVVVTVSSQSSNGLTFTVTSSAPHITSLTPSSGVIGSSVTIAGTNFGATQGTSTVTFNGTSASPTNWSATSIVTPVPTGATTGSVVVTVGGQASNSFTFTVGATPQPADVTTWHYDSFRRGVNATESVLTTSNVNSTTFGKVSEFTVDGAINGQILYLAQVTIPGKGVKNVIYFGTSNDTVYALDADSLTGSTATVLWTKSLLGNNETAATGLLCGNINPSGISATPVIDRARNAIYVEAMSQNTTPTFFQRLHALDLTTGSELFGGPTTITATAPGTGGNSNGTTVTFDPRVQLDRAALLESGNKIYTAWSGNDGDCGPYSPWVIAYDADTLAPAGSINLAPNNSGGGIWMGGGGPSTDTNGSVYVITGNIFGAGSPATGAYGNSFMRLTNSGTIAIGDFFSPENEINLSNGDVDFGSAAPMILPDLTDSGNTVHHLAASAGKDGIMYVLSRDNLGGYSTTANNVYQRFQISTGENRSTPVFFNNTVYLCPQSTALEAFSITNAKLATTPTMQTASTISQGCVPSISANGVTNGIVWALPAQGTVLHAFSAASLSTELYNSTQAGNRDKFASVSGSFITPMVANGRVYFGTGTTIVVFGLLAP